MMLPFKNCFAVDIDLCWVGLSHALLQWLVRDRGPFPDVLWVSNQDIGHIGKVLDFLEREYSKHYRDRISIKVAPDYADGQWSIGSKDDYGFGSVGS